MALSKEIKQLIAIAAQGPGPVPKPKMRATKKRTPSNGQHPETVAKAKPIAVELFEWNAGPMATELRAEMKEANVPAIPLHSWLLCLTQKPGTFQVRRDPNPTMGPFDQTCFEVSDPLKLIDAVGPEVVIATHQLIVNNRIIDHIATYLRQRSTSGAG
jgi:hypothetical protein